MAYILLASEIRAHNYISIPLKEIQLEHMVYILPASEICTYNHVSISPKEIQLEHVVYTLLASEIYTYNHVSISPREIELEYVVYILSPRKYAYVIMFLFHQVEIDKIKNRIVTHSLHNIDSEICLYFAKIENPIGIYGIYIIGLRNVHT